MLVDMKRALLTLAVLLGGCRAPSSAVAPAPATTVEPRAVEPADEDLSTSAAAVSVGGPVAPISLIPADANVVLGVNFEELVSSAVWRANEAKIRAADTEHLLDDARACNLGPDKWRTLVMAVNANASEQQVIVMSAFGIGTVGALECINAKASAQGEPLFASIKQEGDELVVVRAAEQGRGWALDSDTLVLAGPGWQDAVAGLIRGDGKTVMNGPLATTLGGTDVSASLWGAAALPTSMANGVLSGAQDIVGHVYLGSGAGIALRVKFESGESATLKSEELAKAWAGFKGMLGAQGIPNGVLDSVRIEPQVDWVQLTASASDRDVLEISKTIETAMGGI